MDLILRIHLGKQNNLFIVNGNPTNIDFLDVGNRCNLSCPGCYYNERPNFTGINPEEETSLIEKIIQDYPNAWFFIYPPEITTSPALLDSIKNARQKIILSNGYSLTNDMVGRFKEAGLKYVKITYFATPEEQRKWQGVREPAYNRLRRNIENAAKQGLTVFVNNVLWKGNVKSIEELARQCYDMGVERIKFIRYREPKWNEDFIMDGGMDEVVERIEKAKLQKSPRLQMSFTFGGPNLYGKTLEEAKEQLPPQKGEWVKSPYFCPAINQNYWGISLKRGEVYWCYFITDDPIAKIGTVDKDTGKVSIATDIDLRPETLKEKLTGKCSEDKCEYQPVCLGGCRSTAYTFAKMKDEKNPLYAEADICLTKAYERVFRK